MCDTLFGYGMVLTGFHPAVQEQEFSLTNKVQIQRISAHLTPPITAEDNIAVINKVLKPWFIADVNSDNKIGGISMTSHPQVEEGLNCQCQALKLHSKLPTLWKAEELGVTPKKHCLQCTSCRECSYCSQMMSCEDQEIV